MMSYSSHPRRIASNLLLSGGELLPNPVVEVAADGVILSVTTTCDPSQIDRTSSTEFYSGIMCAGFVNAHSHLELAYLRGEIEEGSGFAGFASKIGQVRGNFSDEERDRAVALADIEMRQEGIVAVGDIVNGSSSYDVKRSSSIKYHNFAELFGLRSCDTSAVDPLLALPDTTITPHSIYSLNDELFRRVAHAESEAPLSIHFMESPAEAELFAGRGALHEWYKRVGFECDFLHYGSPAKRIVSSVPRDRSVILVHNCCVEAEDIELIMSHFTAPVYWCVCPESNRYISALRPPLELLRNHKLNICVGTDSLASNHKLSMLNELRSMAEVPLAERLDWATRGGANALGMKEFGEIAVGKSPQINIISGLDYATMSIGDKAAISVVQSSR